MLAMNLFMTAGTIFLLVIVWGIHHMDVVDARERQARAASQSRK